MDFSLKFSLGQYLIKNPNAEWWKIRRRIFLQLECKEFNAQPPKREFFTSALHTQFTFSICLFVSVCDCGIFEKLERVTMVMLIIRSDMWEMCQCSRLHRSESVYVCKCVRRSEAEGRLTARSMLSRSAAATSSMIKNMRMEKDDLRTSRALSRTLKISEPFLGVCSTI